MAVIEQFHDLGIVPVVVVHDVAKAAALADALCTGGLACAEVTFRTDAAEESIRIMTERHPEMLVGAGTVLEVGQAEKALAAGAKFIVSPGSNPEVVDYCLAHNVAVIPGAVTPSEVTQLVNRGLKVIKFFPAETYGGVKTIQALSAAFRGILFMPTGGINERNLKDYLDNESVIACGGSWMVKEELIAAGKFEQIQTMVREAVRLVHEIRR